MANDLPQPLTDPECDLRAFREFPFDIGRFRDSGLVTHENAEAVVAAIHLWGAAWHQVPAASLPDDDRELAKMAGYGRATEAWAAVRSGALHGFIKCADGRLYHTVLAGKANTAWDRRLKYEWSKARDRDYKAQKLIPKADQIPFIDFDAWKIAKRLIPSETPPLSDVPLEIDHTSDGNRIPFRRNDPIFPTDFALKGEEMKGDEMRGEDKEVSKKEKTPKGVKKKEPAALDYVLPDWVPQDEWAGYVEMRAKIKKPLTDRAVKLAVNKLEQLRAEGNPPGKVLDQSTLADWQGLFPLRSERQTADDDFVMPLA